MIIVYAGFVKCDDFIEIENKFIETYFDEIINVDNTYGIGMIFDYENEEEKIETIEYINSRISKNKIKMMIDGFISNLDSFNEMDLSYFNIHSDNINKIKKKFLDSEIKIITYES